MSALSEAEGLKSVILLDGFYAGNAHRQSVDPDYHGLYLPRTSMHPPILPNSSDIGGSNVNLVCQAD